MNASPKLSRRNLRSAAAALLVTALALLVGACSETPPRPAPPEPAVEREVGPVLARDEEFAIVLAAAGDDLSTLAQRYLGAASKRWILAEFNGTESVKPGDTVVVPLRTHNRIGVLKDGFQGVPVLCYHRLGPKAAKLTVTPAAFEAQMGYLAKNGYQVIPLSRLALFLEGKEPLPRKAIAITIDDGYRSTYDYAFPILKKYGFPATVFLYSDFVGASEALTWQQMKEMTATNLIDIQPHSKTHANLTLRQPGENDARYRDRAKREVDAPIGVLRERLGEPSVAYAYPYGDVNDTIVDQLRKQGVRMGLTVTPGANAFYAYPYMLRRNMVFGTDDLEAFAGKLGSHVKVSSR